MISCRQSTEWIIHKEHGSITVKQNLQLLVHLAICSFCRMFAKQSSLINKALKGSERMQSFHLDKTEKEQMLQAIRKKLWNERG